MHFVSFDLNKFGKTFLSQSFSERAIFLPIRLDRHVRISFSCLAAQRMDFCAILTKSKVGNPNSTSHELYQPIEL